MILTDTTSVTLQSSDELARLCRPDFDSSISRSRDDVFLVEVDNVYCCSVSNENFLEFDF